VLKGFAFRCTEKVKEWERQRIVKQVSRWYFSLVDPPIGQHEKKGLWHVQRGKGLKTLYLAMLKTPLVTEMECINETVLTQETSTVKMTLCPFYTLFFLEDIA
jgi:hypothetical protein